MTTDARMPNTISSAITVVIHGMPSWPKNTSNACSTPCVRLMLDESTPTEIASVGKMNTIRMMIDASRMAFGNCLPGLSISFTCTAFISMPAYERKLLTISTMLAMPVHVGSHCASDAGGSSDVPPELRNRIAKSTRPSDGTIVPAMKPHLLTPAKDFTPPKAMNVDSQ